MFTIMTHKKNLKILETIVLQALIVFLLPLLNLLQTISRHPLLIFINNCFKVGRFPRLWKIVKICPMSKVSSATVDSDYRPILLLPIISKVFERIMLY